MLREDVVAAVRENLFNVYPVNSIDEAIELLTGLAAGERDASGKFPPGSLNYLVEKRLKQLANVRKDFINRQGDSEA